MEVWKRIEPTRVHEVGWLTVVRKTFQTHKGDEQMLEALGREGEHCAVVIALTPDHQVIVARQFRPGPEKIMEELPGGVVDPGEDFMAGAIRELEEETGFLPRHIEPLGDIYKDAYSNTVWHYFWAVGCTPTKTGQKLDKDEHIEVGLISIDELIKNARAGNMIDIQAVFLAYDKLVELQGKR